MNELPQVEERWSQRKKTGATSRSRKVKESSREGTENIATKSIQEGQEAVENELRARIRQLRHVEKRNSVEKEQKEHK